MTAIGASGIVEVVDGGGEPLLLVTPEHANLIAQEYTRRQAQQFLFDTAHLPLQHLAPETAKRIQDDRDTEGLPTEATLRIADCPKDIMLVVVGGTGIKSAYIPTWSGTMRAVTRPIDMS